METSPYRPMSTLPNLSPAQLYLKHRNRKSVCKLHSRLHIHTGKANVILLEGEVSIDWSKRLALWRPIGEKFNDPGYTTVSLQLILDSNEYFWLRIKKKLYTLESLLLQVIPHCLLTSMVLSLKYLMYSGPM